MSAPPTHRSGFTLVELLVVLAIIVLLTGMVMPLVGLARRSSMRTVSQSIMAKVEGALRQFKIDYKGYPYQLSYADDGQPWTNALNYNLGTDISLDDQGKVKADMQAAAANYVYRAGNNWAGTNTHTFVANRHNGNSSDDDSNDPEGDPAPNSVHQPVANGPWKWVYPGDFTAMCILLNRMATERANIAVLVGDVDVRGVTMLDVNSGPAKGNLTHHGRDLSALRLVTNQQSDSQHPGWAKDYLRGEIDPRYLRGDTVLDAYFHPLIYICQVTPGCEYAFGAIRNSSVDVPNPAVYGLQPLGRKTLQPYIPGTTTPTPADPQTLPDPSNLMHSDMRYWAPPGYELEFELWSAGPDGRMSWWRDDASNRDNIPCVPYNKGIGVQP